MGGAGAKFGFGFGLQTEFRINSTASFVTGIGGDFLGGKQSYKNGQGYVLNKDGAYTDSKETDFNQGTTGLYNSTNNGDNFYELKSRSVNKIRARFFMFILSCLKLIFNWILNFY